MAPLNLPSLFSLSLCLPFGSPSFFLSFPVRIYRFCFVSPFIFRETILDSKPEFRTAQNEWNVNPRKEKSVLQYRREETRKIWLKSKLGMRNKEINEKKLINANSQTQLIIVIITAKRERKKGQPVRGWIQCNFRY